jgi:cell shape-determining protein MreC
MKKILYLFCFFIFISTVSLAQEGDEHSGGKIREKMTEYIQQRLGLSKTEAERFGPVFINYFQELRRTNQTYKNDRLVLQQKVVELRLNYRDQFRPIIGEKRSNDVFVYERDFIDEVRKIQKERMGDRNENRPGNRR